MTQPRFRSAAGAAAFLAAAATARAAPARAAARPAGAADTTGAVAGVAYDSLAGGVLAGAAIQIAPAPGSPAGREHGGRVHNVRADGAGRYRADSVAPGAYVVAVAHPALDSLGIEAPLRRAVVAGGATTRVDVGVPGPRQLVRQLCPARAVSDTAALLVGFVRDGAGGAGRGGAVVTVAWTEVALTAAGVASERATLSVTAAPGGWFCVCNPPTGVELLVRAQGGGAASGDFPLELAPGAVVRRDVYVGADDEVASGEAGPAARPAAADTLAAGRLFARRGRARLRGAVRNAAGGPVAGALVSVPGAAARAVTGADGTFLLADLPAGTRPLDVRAVGYVPVRTAVDLRTGAPDAGAPDAGAPDAGAPDGAGDSVAVTLHDRARFLDTVRVTAARAADPELAGFVQRRRAGGGLFLDRAAVARRGAVNVSDALVGLPGVLTAGGTVAADTERVVLPQPGGSGRSILLRSLWGRPCTPSVWLDNVRLPGEDLDWYALPTDVAGIEVYARPGQVPARFQDLSGCGAIVVWTDRRR